MTERFVIKRLGPEAQRLGGQFALVSLASPDFDCKLASFSSGSSPSWVNVETYEPIPGLRTRPSVAAVGLPMAYRYRLRLSSIRFEASSS